MKQPEFDLVVVGCAVRTMNQERDELFRCARRTLRVNFVSTAELGYIEKATDIYSRRGAEHAKQDK